MDSLMQPEDASNTNRAGFRKMMDETGGPA
jgi:hypothetical protein